MFNFFDKEKYMLYYERLQLYFRFGLKLKERHHVLEFNQPQRLKPHIDLNTQKKIEAEKKLELECFVSCQQNHRKKIICIKCKI